MPTVLIVGAGPGLGRAIARAFAEPGAVVSLVARRSEHLTAIVDDLRERGAYAETFQADVRDEASLREVLTSAVNQFGVPDVLVYNAAIIQRDRIGQLTSTDHEHAWGTNVVGAVTVLAVIAPLMQQRGRGTVLLTSGMVVPDPDYLSLSLGKAGLRALARVGAEQYGPHGVHIATVTIGGPVVAGTDLDPDTIAAHYPRLHAQPPRCWDADVFLPPGGE